MEDLYCKPDLRLRIKNRHMNKKNIAVVAGGDSSEYVVSIKSAENVIKAIDTEKYVPWLIVMLNGDWKVVRGDENVADIDKGDFSFIYEEEKVKIDYAYIIIHGTPGEDGVLQGYFEMLGIPYSSCGVYSSSLTFNKFYCNNYLQNLNIKIADSIRLIRDDEYSIDEIVDCLGLPLFVKPNAGGSSFGVSKVKEISELSGAIEKAFEESSEVLIEEYIEGTELTCGVVNTGSRKMVFPITEVLPKNEFFNYESKYVPGMADEITPARISDELTLKVQSLSSEIYDLCNCKGIVRVDYILKGEKPYFLEINTVPGMTATSFIPQQIEAMGLSLKDLITEIIENELDL
jgi:D-alanine-D-alanine ligase